MRALQRDERGVSAILGFVIVIALVMMAMGVYLAQQVPEDWRQAEYETMSGVKSSFETLREGIQDLDAGEVSLVKVKMGTHSPTAMLSATTNASLSVASAMNISDLTENRSNERYLGVPGIVGLWHMDEPSWNGTEDEVIDSSDWGNHGTANGASITAYGKKDRGGDFDGDDYVSVSDSNSLDVDTFTLSAWVYPTLIVGSERGIVWKEYGGSADQMSYAILLQADATVRFLRSTAGDSWETILDTTDTVSLDTWTHIAGVYDGTNMIVYINGVESIQTPSAGTTFAGDAELLIGADPGFDGIIDEVIIWDHALTVNEVYETYFGATRGSGTYVIEGENHNYLYENYDNDHLYVSSYENHRIRTYIKFNLRDSFLYTSSTDEFYDDAYIHEVQLLIHTEVVDPVTEPSEFLEAGTPIKIEPWLLVQHEWDESITWDTQPHDESTDTRLDNEDGGDIDEWLAFDVTLIVSDQFEALKDNQTKGLPLEDNLLSFVLREPSTTKLRNRTGFTSRDNYDGGYDYGPRLRIVYSREGRPGKVTEGLVNLGYVKYEANNVYFPSNYYIYEGGAIILQREPGWYEVMLSEPPDFITLASAGGDDISVIVRRYQIEPGSPDGESIGGSGYTSIRVQQEGIENLVSMPSSPNRSQVTISITTDHESAWRSYLERLAAKLNYKMGGEWDQYGEYVKYDYDSISLTIRGKVLDPEGAQDIYYAEQVIWIDTTLGTFAGGRT